MSGLDRPALLLASLAYFLAVAAIGAWSARRTRNARDFYIAGQAVGVLVTGLATTAAAFSGFVFLGGPGLAYRLGVGSLLIAVPLSFTSVLLTWSLGKRLRSLAGRREIFTVPDALAARFGSRRVAGLGAVAVVVGTLGYLGAQIQALAILLSTAFDAEAWLGPWGVPAAGAVGLAVLLGYSIAGGMVAGVYTDVLQGALMAGAAIAVFAAALAAGGGPREVAAAIAADPDFGPRFLDPTGFGWATGLGFFFVFSVGVLGQPHMLHKLYMLDQPGKMRWLPLVVAGSQSLCLLVWLGVGLVVPALVARGALPALAHPDDAMPAFLLGFAPPLLAGLLFAGVLAAIMSTADSFLNVGAAALVRDLPRALGRPVADELAWGRRAVAGLGVAAALFAWAYGDLIALLGTFAFGTFAAGLAPALAIGFHARGVTAAGAAASIGGGVAINLVLELSGRLGWALLPAGVLPSAVALAASFCILFAVSAWDGRRGLPALAPDVAAVMADEL